LITVADSRSLYPGIRLKALFNTLYQSAKNRGEMQVKTLIFAVVLAALSSLLSGYLAFKVRPIYDQNQQCCDIPRFTNLYLSLRELAGLVTFNSQIGQDRWIAYKVFPGVKNGYFVDVGSADGVNDSNSKILEDLGWSGICIDPFPSNMTSRTCTMIKEVVDSKPGRKVRFRSGGYLGGIEEYLGKWKEHKTVKQAQVVELTTTTLEDILDRAKAPKFIHYISLDIEGAELEALKGFPFSRYTVGALTIEHNSEEPKRNQINALLEREGYRRIRATALDDFYVHAGVPIK
jgi:hypothetical protein